MNVTAATRGLAVPVVLPVPGTVASLWTAGGPLGVLLGNEALQPLGQLTVPIL